MCKHPVICRLISRIRFVSVFVLEMRIKGHFMFFCSSNLAWQSMLPINTILLIILEDALKCLNVLLLYKIALCDNLLLISFFFSELNQLNEHTKIKIPYLWKGSNFSNETVNELWWTDVFIFLSLHACINLGSHAIKQNFVILLTAPPVRSWYLNLSWTPSMICRTHN